MGITDLLKEHGLISSDKDPERDSSDPDESPEETPVDDVLEPDPKPVRCQKKRGLKRPSNGDYKATAAEKKKVKDAVDLSLTILGGGISLRDPHCGGAILACSTEASDKAAAIIARNPAWTAWFVGSTGFLDVLGLLAALAPVGKAFWSHHVTHSVGGEHDHGNDDVPDYAKFHAPEI